MSDEQTRMIAVDPYGAPEVHDTAWIAPGALVIGDVTVGSQSSVWYNAVVRGDTDSVRIGARSNVQDGAAIHSMGASPTVIGDDVSIGHNAVVHGATVENGCLIGMNATVLNGAVIGEGTLVAAGAVVTQGMMVPPHSLVAGVPARVRGTLDDAQRELVRSNSERYLTLTEHHARSATVRTT